MTENYLLKNKKRANVRFKKANKKKLVLKYISENGWYISSSDNFSSKTDFKRQDEIYQKLKKRASLLYQHPASCSCFGCGNPRKYFKPKEGLTMQERVFLDKNHPDNKRNWYE